MKNAEVSEQEIEIWRNYFDAWQNYVTTRRDLLINTPSLVELVRQGIINPHQRLAALDAARFMKVEQLQQLFSNLLAIAIYRNGSGTEIASELILTIPHEWLLANIEVQAEKLLTNNNDEDYRGLFLLYRQLDPRLARKLAERAVASPNQEIKEAGEYFIEVLDK